MESFIELCRKFPWSWKIKKSYKRLICNTDDQKETMNELETILSRSVRYIGRTIKSPETVNDLEGILEFLEMLILNLNAVNTELSEEFPNFDHRILPLLEKYSELLVHRSNHSGLEVECMQRIYTFLQGLSIRKDLNISQNARTKKLISQLSLKIKVSFPAPEDSAIENKEVEVNNNIETVESRNEKRVRFAELSPKRIDPIEWDTEIKPESSVGNGYQSSTEDSVGADATSSKDKGSQKVESYSNTLSTESVGVNISDELNEDGETEQEESNSRYHSLEPNSTIIRKEEISVIEKDSSSRYYSLEPNSSIPAEKREKSRATFDLSSDDEFDNELLTPLESIIKSLASPALAGVSEGNQDIRRQLFANHKKDANLSPSVKPSIPVHERRVVSSESTSEDGPPAQQSASNEAIFFPPLARAVSQHSDSDSTIGEIILKASSTPVVELTRPQQLTEQAELSYPRFIIPESPMKGEGSVRVLGVASICEITPILSSSEPFVFPRVPSSSIVAPVSVTALSPTAVSSPASSTTLRKSKASSSTEKLSRAVSSVSSIASSTAANLSSAAGSTPTTKLPSSDGCTTTAELSTSSPSSLSVTSKSDFSIVQLPEDHKMKETALVATAKWIVEIQPVVGGNSPATAAVQLRHKVMKALSRPVRERRLRSSKWNVSDVEAPSSNLLVPDKTSSIKTGLLNKIVPTTDTEESPSKPGTVTLKKLKNSMEGNLLGCDASISDAEILEEIESSVNRSGGSDEDPSCPVHFNQEDGNVPDDNLTILSAFDNNVLEDPSFKNNQKRDELSGKGTSPAEQQRRRSSRLSGQPYCIVPLVITRKKEPLPGKTAPKRKLTIASDLEEVQTKKVATTSKRKLTMAPSPEPISAENCYPLLPITWEEVRKQLPPCWASLINQHVMDTRQENTLMYREGTPISRLKVFCPCTPHIGPSVPKCME